MEFSKNIRIFGKTRALEGEIEDFLDRLSTASLIFKHAIDIYLRDGATEEFNEKLSHVNGLESEADTLRRSIERQLYAHTLIPESRGDVLGLIENLDKILNKIEGALWNFSIETPDIHEDYHADFRTLTEMSVLSVEHLVIASRAFFVNVEDASNHNHKVMFYEKETDKIGTKLKRAIFSSDMVLAQKAHVRNFVEHIDNIADLSEDVADRLAIYIIKRTV